MKLSIADKPQAVMTREVHGKAVEATYAWLLSTDTACLSGRRFFNAVPSPFVEHSEGEERGPRVGYLTKLDPRDGEIKWAGPESPSAYYARDLVLWEEAQARE